VNVGILFGTQERNAAILPSVWIVIVFVFIFIFIFSFPSFAIDAETVSGTVVDPSGAVVSSATVIIRNSDTGAQQNSATDAEGVYRFPDLPAGPYEIEITAPGFKPYRQTGVKLAAPGAIKVDVQLELKSETTTVEVSVDKIQIDVSITQMGEAIAANQMSAVPLNGRSFTDLMAIQPGTKAIPGDSTTATSTPACSVRIAGKSGPT